MAEPQFDVERLRALDEQTLSELFDYVAPRIRSLVQRRGQINLEADEVVSEVFLHLVKDPERLASLVSEGRVTVYSLLLARNTVAHRVWRTRKQSSIQTLENTAPTGTSSSEETRQMMGELLAN